MNIRIKGFEGQYINFQIVCYSHPEADDFWDGNWLDCLVSGEIPGYSFNFPTSLRIDEFESFYKDLCSLFNSLSGAATLVGMESNIDILVNVNRLGILEWKCRTTYPSGYGATLEYEFQSDQSYLSKLINDLKRLLEQFPIKGR